MRIRIIPAKRPPAEAALNVTQAVKCERIGFKKRRRTPTLPEFNRVDTIDLTGAEHKRAHRMGLGEDRCASASENKGKTLSESG